MIKKRRVKGGFGDRNQEPGKRGRRSNGGADIGLPRARWRGCWDGAPKGGRFLLVQGQERTTRGEHQQQEEMVLTGKAAADVVVDAVAVDAEEKMSLGAVVRTFNWSCGGGKGGCIIYSRARKL